MLGASPAPLFTFPLMRSARPMTARKNTPSFQVKLFSRIVFRLGHCWIWVGGAASNGRPRFWNVSPYRFMYELANGKIPNGLVVDHLCRNVRCVNPDHLEAVTVRENTLRGNGPTAINARKTHCIHGHALSGYNLLFHRNWRSCRTCRNASKRALRRQRRMRNQ
ncbi:MAG: HNH endonuclease signature motif containing protein [Burkholderiales bacterium]